MELTHLKDASLIPIIGEIGLVESLIRLSALFGFSNYEYDLNEFWILDTMASLLQRAQKENPPLSKENQLLLLNWFCDFLQSLQNPKSERNMMDLFEDSMVKAAEASFGNKDGLHGVAVIVDLILEIFANDFTTKLISSAFSKTKDPKVVSMNWPINAPKKFYKAPSKLAKKSTPKKAKSPKVTESRETASETKEAEIELMRESILPLRMSVDEAFYQELWPAAAGGNTAKKVNQKKK